MVRLVSSLRGWLRPVWHVANAGAALLWVSMLASVAFQQLQPWSVVPTPWWTTSGGGCPTDGFGLTDEFTVVGLPLQVVPTEGAAAVWMDARDQCRVMLLREARGIQRIRQRTSAEDEVILPQLGCGRMHFSGQETGEALAHLTGCGTSLYIADESIVGPNGDILIVTRSRIGMGGTTHSLRKMVWYSYSVDGDLVGKFLRSDNLTDLPSVW